MKFRNWIFTTALIFEFAIAPYAVSDEWVENLRLSWTNGTQSTVLTFNKDSDDWKLRTRSIRENDIQSGKLKYFKGFLLSEVVNNYLESIPYIQSANVDLIVIEGEKHIARIPRALINKYPILLAGEKKPRIVLPRATTKEFVEEPLPINEYDVTGVTQIRLTSYALEYGPKFFVDVRGNPLAERGSKRFVQACLGCHFQKEADFLGKVSLARSGAVSRNGESSELEAHRAVSSDVNLSGQWHDNVQGYPKLDAMDQKGIRKYLDLLLRNSNENSQSMQTVKSDTAWRESI